MNRLIKTGLSLSMIITSVTGYSQKYICKNGETSFFSETPMEDISALNTKVVSLINTEDGSLAVKMNIIDFEFPNKLMQEHFNENYLESEKYPKSVFSGKILEKIDFSKDSKHKVTGQGNIVIHGQAQKVNLEGTLTVNGDQLILEAAYLIKPEDYNIEIPSLVITKIAKEISVKSKFVYNKLS